MEVKFNWKDFWQEYRNKDVETEDDLYYQVGKTVHKKPVGRDVFDLINKNIYEYLVLNPNDIMVELCCGNGLCTYEFRDKVKQIIAVDFAGHLIKAAKEFKSAPNITYCLSDVISFLETFKDTWDVRPSKYLMNDCLAYFVPRQLERILDSILSISKDKFIVYIKAVPNEHRILNFYNTKERRQKFLNGTANGDVTNDGLGRRWAPDEVSSICERLNLNCDIFNEDEKLSNYRMDIVISN